MDEVRRKRQQHEDAVDADRTQQPAVPTPEETLAERDQRAEADDGQAVARDRVAETDDLHAAVRDQAATARDARADSRDRDGTDTAPPLFADRRKTRSDRADAADDRAASADDRDWAALDRERAAEDRKTSGEHRTRADADRSAAHDAVARLRLLLANAEDESETMFQIAKAQGMIMAARGVSDLEALLELGLRAAHDQSELVAAAQSIVREDLAEK